MQKTFLWVSGVMITLALISGCMVSKSGPYGRVSMVIVPAIPAPVFEVRPALVLVDGAPGVYFVSGLNVYCYHDTWYYYCQGKWFSGAGHNGPWAYVEPNRMPAPLGRIPPGHLRAPPGQVKAKIIPPGQAKDKDKGRGKDSPGHGRDQDNDDDSPGRGHGRNK